MVKVANTIHATAPFAHRASNNWRPVVSACGRLIWPTMLEELEIKIGGALNRAKAVVACTESDGGDCGRARGGTPGVELVSPPPHHDTYSIEVWRS